MTKSANEYMMSPKGSARFPSESATDKRTRAGGHGDRQSRFFVTFFANTVGRNRAIAKSAAYDCPLVCRVFSSRVNVALYAVPRRHGRAPPLHRSAILYFTR